MIFTILFTIGGLVWGSWSISADNMHDALQKCYDRGATVCIVKDPLDEEK